MERWQSTVVGEPLAAFRDGFGGWLEARGYASGSVVGLVRLMASLARWMGGRVGVGGLTAAVVADYAAWRRSSGYKSWRSPAALAPLVAYLGDAGVLPDEPEAAMGRVDALVAGFAGWLAGERGAGEGAVKRNLVWARAFADGVFGVGEAGAGRRVGVRDVEGFVAVVARRLEPSSMGGPVAALRQFLRYLASEGMCDVALADAVPAVKRARRLGLPALVAAGAVESVLAGCADRGAAGRRAAAVTALAADLGLRGAEIARLTLDDIDWAHAVVAVAGKNGLREEMPLTERAGRAVADWLRFGRRPLATRHVFHTARAPLKPMTALGVAQAFRAAGTRAGLDGFTIRAVRHSLGCAVVAGEGTLEDAGQLLRHLSSSATAIYARVDVSALGELAVPWPGAAS